MAKSWEERKALADSKGTCPRHINDLLENQRCLKCEYNYKERRDSLLILGKCPKHGETDVVDGVCPKCLDKRDRNKKVAAESNTCKGHLEVKLVAGKCPTCTNNRKSIRDIYTLSKVCVQHSQISIAEAPCWKCHENYNLKRENSIKNKICFNHPEETVVSGMMCFDCWCASIAGDALGSKKLKEVVKESFLKNPYCFFTGVKLTPGHKSDSASFDHIIPLARKGPKVIENCQWTQLIVNLSKNDRTNEEYLLELLTIYKNKDRILSSISGIPVECMAINKDFDHCSRCRSSKFRTKLRPEIASYCKKHYFEAVSLKHFKTVKFTEDLEELFLKQGGLDRYVGSQLILGAMDKNFQASLDHLIPPKRGGLQEMSNVQWVSKRTNTLKQNMTHDELLSFAELIVKRFDLKI